MLMRVSLYPSIAGVLRHDASLCVCIANDSLAKLWVYLQKINQTFGDIACYDLLYDEVTSLSNAYIRAVDSYTVNVLITVDKLVFLCYY